MSAPVSAEAPLTEQIATMVYSVESLGEPMDGWGWVSDLYREEATSTLYHYTSLGGALAIVPKAQLFATELRYLNDTSEGSHLAALIAGRVTTFMQTPLAEGQQRLLRQFHPWVLNRMRYGSMVFTASFTRHGDQLSQWRGYGPPGKGVSLGFNPKTLRETAHAQRFQLGRCIYSRQEHDRMAQAVVEWLLHHADQEDTAPPTHPDNSFHALFESVETHLLRASALVKNPAFEEEQEWRVVSEAVGSYREGSPIRYREGASMLIPHLLFELPKGPKGAAVLERVVVGPTPHPEAARESVHRFLYGAGSYPSNHVDRSAIPYRAW